MCSPLEWDSRGCESWHDWALVENMGKYTPLDQKGYGRGEGRDWAFDEKMLLCILLEQDDHSCKPPRCFGMAVARNG